MAGKAFGFLVDGRGELFGDVKVDGLNSDVRGYFLFARGCAS